MNSLLRKRALKVMFENEDSRALFTKIEPLARCSYLLIAKTVPQVKFELRGLLFPGREPLPSELYKVKADVSGDGPGRPLPAHVSPRSPVTPGRLAGVSVSGQLWLGGQTRHHASPFWPWRVGF